MSEHTPGPWTRGPSWLGEYFVDISAPSHGSFASIVVAMEGCEPSEELRANANLFFAAGDMLEALEGLIEALEGSDLEDDLEAGEEGFGPVEQARDAVALAKGFIRTQEECEVCGGDGQETCTNPDHGFIDAMGGETSRLGCPVCGHDPDHKVPDGGNCEECEGRGHVYTLAAAEVKS